MKIFALVFLTIFKMRTKFREIIMKCIKKYSELSNKRPVTDKIRTLVLISQ